MNDKRPASESSKPESITKQVVILLISGFILSAGSCAGFLGSINGSGTVSFLLAGGFLAGLVIMIGAIIWAIVRAGSSN